MAMTLAVDGAPVLQATDDGVQFGGPAFTGGGLSGIRTDFLDVDFSGYHAAAD
ncbi:MAG: hypothetical protein ACREQQ_18315 [Candidatus Binatia bacterium]